MIVQNLSKSAGGRSINTTPLPLINTTIPEMIEQPSIFSLNHTNREPEHDADLRLGRLNNVNNNVVYIYCKCANTCFSI